MICTRLSTVCDIRPSIAVDVNITFPAELLSLHRGQGLEILWRDSLSCPSEEEYIDMVNNSQSVRVAYNHLYPQNLQKPVVYFALELSS